MAPCQHWADGSTALADGLPRWSSSVYLRECCFWLWQLDRHLQRTGHLNSRRECDTRLLPLAHRRHGQVVEAETSIRCRWPDRHRMCRRHARECGSTGAAPLSLAGTHQSQGACVARCPWPYPGRPGSVRGRCTDAPRGGEGPERTNAARRTHATSGVSSTHRSTITGHEAREARIRQDKRDHTNRQGVFAA